MRSSVFATSLRLLKRHVSCIPCLIPVFFLWSFSTAAAQTEVFVSPDGSDQNDGRSSQRPFASIERARDEMRKLKAAGSLFKGGAAVEILGGKYLLQKQVEFTDADSGAPEFPIVYRSYQGQPVELIGGRILKLSDFATVTDPDTMARMDSAARGKVVALSLSALGITHGGPYPPVFADSGGIFELFWNGKRLPISRWPNQGWTTIKSVLTNGDNKTPGVFEYRDERPARWANNPGVWLKGQWRVGWEDPAIRVAKIDTQAHTVAFAAGIQNGIGNKYTRPAGNGKEPWCALNLLEEIDQPGEWAIDFATQMLYLWPPSSSGELMVSQLDKPMIAVNGAAHLSFAGITFECSLGNGIVMQHADSVLIAGCTFRNLAKGAVVMGGVRCGVQSCDMYDLGEGCVMVSGGDQKALTPSGNFVVNNHLHDYGALKAMYSAAVDVGFGGASNAQYHKTAVGVRVANNLIHDAPRDAVLVSGQDNVFELNDIYRCGFQSADVGAFYSWFDWRIRGIVIRHNFIHDTVGGVNPDDGASGSLVFGNIFAGPRTGVWIASGPDHTVRNNIFVKAEGPVFGVDDRGISRKYATHPKLLTPLQAVDPQQPPWSTRFPEASETLATHPELPMRTKFENNLIVIQQGEPFVLKVKKETQAVPGLFLAANNYVTNADPGFENVAHGNYALKKDSEVYQKIPGFEPIPFEKIGLFTDEYRKVLPSEAESRPSRQNEMLRKQEEKNFGT